MKKLLNSGIFWTIIIGIIGIVATIFIYEFSNKVREPVYAIKKEPSIIFDKDNASPIIKLLLNDSLVINENVYITTLVIWNNGRLEIKKSDVREDFKVKISEGAKVLAFNIVNQTHANVSKFKINQQADELIIDWDYFDPGFGFELQIIYKGVEDSEIMIDGYVLDAEIKKVTPRKVDTFLIFLLIGMWFPPAIYIFIYIKRKKVDRIILLGAAIMIIGNIILTSYMLLGGFVLPL